MVLPCCLMMSLSLLVFYIPPESGEKLSFGMNVLVVFSVFLLLISGDMPKSSLHLPRISKSVGPVLFRLFFIQKKTCGLFAFSDIFLLTNLVATLIPLVSTTIVLHLHSRKHEQEPKWMNSAIFKKLFKVFPGISQPSTKTHKKNDNVKEKVDEDKQEDKQRQEADEEREKQFCEQIHGSGEHKWIQCAKMAERLFFWLWLFVLLWTFLILTIMSVRSAKNWETK